MIKKAGNLREFKKGGCFLLETFWRANVGYRKPSGHNGKNTVTELQNERRNPKPNSLPLDGLEHSSQVVL